MKNKLCHDCGVKEGETHNLGCDMERCPKCHSQLISCGCWNESVGGDEWLKQLNKLGRVPYIHIPVICALCGELNPRFFHDNDWKLYVVPELQDKVLCYPCYRKQIELLPKGWKK